MVLSLSLSEQAQICDNFDRDDIALRWKILPSSRKSGVSIIKASSQAKLQLSAQPLRMSYLPTQNFNNRVPIITSVLDMREVNLADGFSLQFKLTDEEERNGSFLGFGLKIDGSTFKGFITLPDNATVQQSANLTSSTFPLTGPLESFKTKFKFVAEFDNAHHITMILYKFSNAKEQIKIDIGTCSECIYYDDGVLSMEVKGAGALRLDNVGCEQGMSIICRE